MLSQENILITNNMNNNRDNNQETSETREEFINDETDDSYITDIVVTGMSGRFPTSSSIDEFEKNLRGKLVFTNKQKDVWSNVYKDGEYHIGQIKCSPFYDAQFFGITKDRALAFNHELRFLTECVAEAVIDSGNQIEALRRQSTGIFIACSVSDEFGGFTNYTGPEESLHYKMQGCIKTSYANHLRSIFNLRGPAMSVDTNTSSSMTALDWAIKAIKQGACNCAIVGGVNFNREINNSIIHGVTKSSEDGRKSNFYDTKYYKNEAVVVIFLQRKNVAKRIYATLYDIIVNLPDDKIYELLLPSKVHRPNYVLQNIERRMENLITETCENNLIDPSSICYVELTNNFNDDYNSIQKRAISNAFNKSEIDMYPLIGSTSSLVGNTGAANELVSLVKIILSLENNHLLGDYQMLNNSAFDGIFIRNERGDPKPLLPTNYLAINSINFKDELRFGIIKKNEISMPSLIGNKHLLRILAINARTEVSITFMFKNVLKYADNFYYYQLLSELTKLDSNIYNARGYIVYNPIKMKMISQNITTIYNHKNSIPKIYCIINPGKGDYLKIAKRFMGVPIFKKSILESCDFLFKNFNYDLLTYIISGIEPSFEDVNTKFLNSSIAIIGMIDMLSAIEFYPETLFGSLFNELFIGYYKHTIEKKDVLEIVALLASMNENLRTPDCRIFVYLTIRDKKKQLLTTDHNIIVIAKITKTSVIAYGNIKEINKLSQEYIIKEVKQSSSNNSIEPAILEMKNFVELSNIYIGQNFNFSNSNINSFGIRNLEKSILDIAKSSSRYSMENILKIVSNVQCNSIIFTLGIRDTNLIEKLESLRLNSKLIHGIKSNKNTFFENFLKNIGEIYTLGGEIKPHLLYPKLPYPVPRGTPSISSTWEWKSLLFFEDIDRDSEAQQPYSQFLNQLYRINKEKNPDFFNCSSDECICFPNKPFNEPEFTV
uniref:PKS_KS domain-containing protein n=1 Tax=Parastrongyloides trichosuri TaxID=131310 RepID=A0A0N5A697_PARTI